MEEEHTLPSLSQQQQIIVVGDIHGDLVSLAHVYHSCTWPAKGYSCMMYSMVIYFCDRGLSTVHGGTILCIKFSFTIPQSCILIAAIMKMCIYK